MSLIGKLVAFAHGALDRESGDSLPRLSDEHLAAAALLVHVARVDGMIEEGERRSLLTLLETGYGLDGASARALLARADRLDLEIDDVGSLVEMLGHEGHGVDRARLLGMAYGVAAADGRLAEFEENLLWRLGHLLRFDDGAIADIRARNVGAAVVVAQPRA